MSGKLTLKRSPSQNVDTPLYNKVNVIQTGAVSCPKNSSSIAPSPLANKSNNNKIDSLSVTHDAIKNLDQDSNELIFIQNNNELNKLKQNEANDPNLQYLFANQNNYENSQIKHNPESNMEKFKEYELFNSYNVIMSNSGNEPNSSNLVNKANTTFIE